MINKKEILIFSALFILFISIAIFINYPNVYIHNYHFGGEYGNIAASLIAGNGYANTFETDSGPTAWMPPLYTYFLFIIFFFFGVKTTLSVYVLLFFKYIALSIIPVLLYRICKYAYPGNRSLLIIPIYILSVFYYFFKIFRMTHDFWIMMLLITLLFYKYSLCVVNQKEIGKGWGVLGGIAFLTNPILGMISIILTFLPYTKTCLKKRLIILSVTLIVCSPWIIRNYIVFNQFILVKSNLYFDMYQGNYLDEDGLLDDNTFINYHPYKNSSVRSIYTVMGEKNFLAEYRKKLIVKLQEEPMTFIKKSINRLVKTFLVCPILSGEVKSAGLIGYLQYMIKASIYCLPFLLSIFYVIKKDFRINKTIQIAIIIFFLYLSPYIFVGFYTRYRIPLSPIFSILYFYFFSMYALDYFCWFKRITVLPKDSK